MVQSGNYRKFNAEGVDIDDSETIEFTSHDVMWSVNLLKGKNCGKILKINDLKKNSRSFKSFLTSILEFIFILKNTYISLYNIWLNVRAILNFLNFFFFNINIGNYNTGWNVQGTSIGKNNS